MTFCLVYGSGFDVLTELPKYLKLSPDCFIDEKLCIFSQKNCISGVLLLGPAIFLVSCF